MLDDLRNGSLMRRLTPLASKILRETIPQEPKRRRQGEMVRSLRPDEEYVRSTLISAGELLTVCEQMAYAIEYLSGFRARKMQSGEPITRLDYIVYHLENHLIRTGAVLDRALLLVNVVFRLGVTERECRFAVIAHNNHVTQCPVAAALKLIENTIKPYQSQRNLVVHRRRHTEEALEQLEVYYVLQKSEVIQPDNDVVKDFLWFYKHLTDAFITAKKDELSKFNGKVFLAVSNLFQTLEPVFDVNYATLRGGC
jgi:hypothetical protein